LNHRHAARRRRQRKARRLRRSRPVRHQVRRVHRSNSRRKVPSSSRPVRQLVRAARSRQHSVSSRRLIAVMRARAVHIHVALGHVVENARASRAISQRRVARAASARAILGCRQLVVRRIRIALLRPSLLIHQRLDACQNWRRERRSARSGPSTGCARASRAAARRIRIAEYVVVAPHAVRRE